MDEFPATTSQDGSLQVVQFAPIPAKNVNLILRSLEPHASTARRSSMGLANVYTGILHTQTPVNDRADITHVPLVVASLDAISER